MASEPERDQPSEGADQVRRAAQDSAGELARMGIEPHALGLDPPPVSPAGPPSGPPARGVAQVSGPPPPTVDYPGSGRATVPGDRPATPAPGGARGAITYGRPRPAEQQPPPGVPRSPATAPSTPPAPVTPGGEPGPGGLSPPVPPAGAPTGAAVGRASADREDTDLLDSTLSRPIGLPARPAAPGPAPEYLPRLAELVSPLSAAPGARMRRLARAVSFGLFQPGAAAAMEQERLLVARARRRRPEPRVIAFIAGKGGVGSSTTAAAVGLTLAMLRTDTVALLGTRAGGGSLAERLGGGPAPPVPGQAADPLWLYGNLAVLDAPPWHSPAPGDSLGPLLDRLRGQHPLTLVDVGADLSEPGQAALASADQVVLVAGASQDAVAAVRVALSRIHQVDPFRLSTAVVALVCLNGRQDRNLLRRLRTDLGVQGPRIVPVRFDPWLAAGAQVRSARLRPATQEAYLRLAGLVVEPGGDDQWFAQPAATGPGAGPGGGGGGGGGPAQGHVHPPAGGR